VTASSIADAARAAAELPSPGLLGGAWHDAFIAPHRATMTSVATTSVDPLRQHEATRYQRGRRRLEAVRALVSLGLGLLGAAVAGWLAAELETAGPLIVDVALFVAVLGAAAELAQLPLALVGWNRAREAGLSRQRLPGWLADRGKGLVIAAVLGIPLVAALVATQREWPDAWWLIAAAGAILVELALATVAPVLILPLFLRSSDLPPGALRDELLGLARRAGVRVPAVRVLHAGAKTAAANAFVTGFGPTRRIMLFDTLIGEDDTPDDARLDETRAVLGHELGHHRSLDLWRFVGLGSITTLASFALAAWLLSIAPEALAHGGAGSIAALPAFAVCLGIAELPFALVTLAYSRRRERAADAFGTRLLGSGEPFARALERMCAQNLAELSPPRLYVALRMSHPAPGERIAAARTGDAAPGTSRRPRLAEPA
jgi:STE24 endopeptidase